MTWLSELAKGPGLTPRGQGLRQGGYCHYILIADRDDEIFGCQVLSANNCFLVSDLSFQSYLS